ncbi:Ig-like domain repeat protein [Conexibacter stalactiti]|uniref:Ig-like domain repeat protein n=1 Tax=Conexibacter stalactiti TaxID=1940611 RepID=A0ABU4HXT3_9ACTN|nr:Ig-like domain repeat protein [Conexibacter stalactiti]MDW5598135.1 Ig-like domain repeat protein [Conexibacter stalactiti]MEC5038777.1 Ig-like domain repeat protein [Conexibacter stalactiti]
MKLSRRWTRSAAVLAAIAPLAVAATNASAAPLRTADTTRYTSALYLQDVLGLPSSETDPAIESVTYDHLHWLLQQSGNYPVLIGDPATDGSFAARARDVEAAADAANVQRVYWFNPNLSGNAKVGNVTQPNLDIRNPAGITSLPDRSQTTYGDAWRHLVARHLGNGVTSTVTSNGGVVSADTTKITTATRTTTVNDAGATAGQSTEVGNSNGGALYDYSAIDQPADVTESYFFVYNKDRTTGGQASKIASWVDLTDKADSAGARADVTTAINTVGAGNLAASDQFAWWKSAANARQRLASRNTYQGVDVPVLTDADDADDWRIEQVTYPELVHLLEHDKTVGKETIVFFGGTWCTNTRPVLPAINKYAQQNDVRVFNFDTVLDGATVGGGATSSANPLQSRNTAVGGGVTNANASFIYGELFDHYLGNAVTEYGAGNPVTYYREGRTTNQLVTTKKLQVPYLIGYKGSVADGPHGGVTRQWISSTGTSTYREFMSNWWYVNPQAGQLGLSNVSLPANAPVWSRINGHLATFSWQTDVATVIPNSAIDTDDAEYLVDGDKAEVEYIAASGGRPSSVDVDGSTAVDAVDISPAALSDALATLGGAAPANLAAARTAFIAAYEATPRDDSLVRALTTVVGAWSIAQDRKTTVTDTWSRVAFGQKAVRAAEVFFAELPTYVPDTQREDPRREDPPVVVPPVVVPPVVVPPVVRPPVDTKPIVRRVKARKLAGGVAKAPTRKKGGTYKVTITSPKGGAKATGRIKLTLKKGKLTKTISGRLSRGTVTLKVPKLARGTWKVTITWSGDARYAAAKTTGASIKVK